MTGISCQVVCGLLLLIGLGCQPSQPAANAPSTAAAPVPATAPPPPAAPAVSVIPAPSGEYSAPAATPFSEPTPTATPPTTAGSASEPSIPETPAAGAIHGRPFMVERAVLENGVLTLRQGSDFFPDLALDVMMFIEQNEQPAGKQVRISPGQTGKQPLLRLQWKEGEGLPKTEQFASNYTLTLELGAVQDGKLPGRIYAAIPDDQRSTIAGTFVIENVR